MASPIAPVIIANNSNADISEYITDITVNLTLDQASQISISVLDPALNMTRANYFQLRQPIEYLGIKMEIAVIEIQQNQAGPLVHLDCRPAGIQTLKRLKTGEVVNAGSATGYVAGKARDVGLSFFGQAAPARKAVAQAATPNADESVWDIMRRLAGECGFVIFENDGRLFFCSEPYLLGKFAIAGYGVNSGFLSIPVKWDAEPMNTGSMQRFGAFIGGPANRPPIALGSTGVEVKYLQQVLRERAGQVITDLDGTFGQSTVVAVTNLQRFFAVTGNDGKVGSITWSYIDFLAGGIASSSPAFGSYYITPLGIPSVRVSDDAYEAATASFQVEREQGKSLRPGMTVSIQGIPGFEGSYLVTEVSWREGVNDAVSVNTRTLVEPKPNANNQNEELNIFRQSLSLSGGGLALTDYTSILGTSG